MKTQVETLKLPKKLEASKETRRPNAARVFILPQPSQNGHAQFVFVLVLLILGQDLVDTLSEWWLSIKEQWDTGHPSSFFGEFLKTSVAGVAIGTVWKNRSNLLSPLGIRKTKGGRKLYDSSVGTLV